MLTRISILAALMLTLLVTQPTVCQSSPIPSQEQNPQNNKGAEENTPQPPEDPELPNQPDVSNPPADP